MAAEKENQTQAAAVEPPAKLLTGIPNLDRILGGGLLRGSIVMVIGAPGTGKTILAEQLSFSLAANELSTLFLTSYSEPHEKLLAHGSSLDFFDAARIGKEIHLLSLTDLLQQGAAEAEAAIVAMARKQCASLVVLDGFRSMRRFLPDENTVAQFLYSLGAKLSFLGITTLVAVEGDPDESARFPELTVCDTVLSLQRLRDGGRFRRMLDVRKMRGVAALEGIHPFTIDHGGLTFSPRFESVVSAGQSQWVDGRAGFGVPELDALVGGGLTAGTTTLVAGGPGVGKTSLGLHFATQGALHGEPTLFLGFMEDATQLRAKAESFGLDLAAAEASGLLRLMLIPGYDLDADRIAEQFVEDIEQRGVRRLVIDSVANLQRGIVTSDRIPDFLAALVAYLRGHRVTSIVTLDINTIVGPTLDLADVPLSVLAENLFLLRYAEYYGALHRIISVLKMRFSDYDATLHEYTIRAGEGIRLLGKTPGGTGLLTGSPQLLSDTPPSGRAPERGV